LITDIAYRTFYVVGNARTPRSVNRDATPATRARTSEPTPIDDLAHRISQPLAAIVAYARGCQLRLRNQTLQPADLDRALEDIAQEALRAGALLGTLRETMTEQKK